MSKNITNGRDEPQTAAALEARRVTAQAAHQRVHHVLARMRKEKAPITVAAVARRAGVSRTFLYTNPEARTAVACQATSAVGTVGVACVIDGGDGCGALGRVCPRGCRGGWVRMSCK